MVEVREHLRSSLMVAKIPQNLELLMDYMMAF